MHFSPEEKPGLTAAPIARRSINETWLTKLRSNRRNFLPETIWIASCWYKEAWIAYERSKPYKDPMQRTDAAALLGLAATISAGVHR